MIPYLNRGKTFVFRIRVVQRAIRPLGWNGSLFCVEAEGCEVSERLRKPRRKIRPASLRQPVRRNCSTTKFKK